MNSQTYYIRSGQSNCVLSRINHQLKPKEINEQRTKLYQEVSYTSEGEEKQGFLSLEQIKSLLKSKSQDMEITINGEKRYISSTLLDIYLLENEGLIYFNVL